MTDVRLGDDLDAVPVANATERTAPTWEARALAAEARLAALVTSLGNYMDKPWSTTHDWWADVHEAFFAGGGEFTPEHFIDPYRLGVDHGRAIAEAQP